MTYRATNHKTVSLAWLLWRGLVSHGGVNVSEGSSTRQPETFRENHWGYSQTFVADQHWKSQVLTDCTTWVKWICINWNRLHIVRESSPNSTALNCMEFLASFSSLFWVCLFFSSFQLCCFGEVSSTFSHFQWTTCSAPNNKVCTQLLRPGRQKHDSK